jgi:hypothetical protein
MTSGMACTVCRKHTVDAAQNNLFVEQPSTNYRGDILTKYERSDGFIAGMSKLPCKQVNGNNYASVFLELNDINQQ